MVVHFVLSIVLAFIFAWVASRWRMSLGMALLVGAVFGLLVYLINFYPVAAALFPWFAMGRNWITIISHIAFGLVLAWSYGHCAQGPKSMKRVARGIAGQVRRSRVPISSG